MTPFSLKSFAPIPESDGCWNDGAIVAARRDARTQVVERHPTVRRDFEQRAIVVGFQVDGAPEGQRPVAGNPLLLRNCGLEPDLFARVRHAVNSRIASRNEHMRCSALVTELRISAPTIR